MLSLQELDELVWEWATDRGITSSSTTVAQLTETLKEVGETIRAVVSFEKSWDSLTTGGTPEDSSALSAARNKVKTEFGDVFITLIIAAGMLNMSMQECLDHAYNKISSRTARIDSRVA